MKLVSLKFGKKDRMVTKVLLTVFSIAQKICFHLTYPNQYLQEFELHYKNLE